MKNLSSGGEKRCLHTVSPLRFLSFCSFYLLKNQAVKLEELSFASQRCKQIIGFDFRSTSNFGTGGDRLGQGGTATDLPN